MSGTVPGVGASDSLALSVHGEHGAVDLVVPRGASIADVAGRYAAECALAEPPVLLTATGRRLSPDASLAASHLEPGDVLVATHGVVPTPGSPDARAPVAGAGGARPAVVAGCVAAGLLAVLSAAVAVRASADVRLAVVVVLLAAAFLGVLPLGRYAAPRAAVAPAFLAAAAFVFAHDQGALRLPLAVGVAGLAGAVGAGGAQALTGRRTEVHDVWIAAGLTTFVVTGVGVLASAPPQVVWAVLLVLATLAARFVPGFAIDVPDPLLVDLERLAVNAWSARDRTTTGRRGRTVVPEASIAALLARGARLVDAAAAAVLAVAVLATPNLLATATLGFDRYGAVALVFFAGGGFLLAARSYRHRPARVCLRLAGLQAWAVLAVDVVPGLAPQPQLWVAIVALLLATGALLAALATGRGWRSVRWARRAEVAEMLCGAFALGSVVVASGLFRSLWE